MDTFPCSFKCEMEEVMFAHHKKTDTRVTVDVYYGRDHNKLSTLAMPPPLSDAPTLTDEDRVAIKTFNAEYVAFMEDCIDTIQRCLPKSQHVKKMRKWCERVNVHHV